LYITIIYKKLKTLLTHRDQRKSIASLRYFHHDQLGSIAAITNEAGAIVERLAYDPWGKRRNTNGISDVNDSLVGVSTDRGLRLA
jgi:hypothetical protein